jgi:hypothetical protein
MRKTGAGKKMILFEFRDNTLLRPIILSGRILSSRRPIRTYFSLPDRCFRKALYN